MKFVIKEISSCQQLLTHKTYQTVVLYVVLFLIHGVSLLITMGEFANNNHCTVSLYMNETVVVWDPL